MPIIRKVLEVGNSKCVSIPAGWLEYFQKETGVEITEVAIEVNRCLTVTPVLPKPPKTSNKKRELGE